MASPAPRLSPAKTKTGLALWMERVLEECDRAGTGLTPDAVHDLRVFLRRCRSVADGVMAIDPDPQWKRMKKAGRRLFRSFGALRDVHVMQEWTRRLSGPEDRIATALLDSLAFRESQLKTEAAKAVQAFDKKQWRKWSIALPRRLLRLRKGSEVFQHLALERWTEARQLHRRVLRNRSRIAFHSLRIGIKRFRYTVENFLPQHHHDWADDLKELQDLLGEVHDLDVLWASIQQLPVHDDDQAKFQWQRKIAFERDQRISSYRKKMMGKDSLWQVWRRALPDEKQVRRIGLARLKLWASALDPDVKHSTHVGRLALQLYDSLPARKAQVHGNSALLDERAVLQLAGLFREVGWSKSEKKPYRAAYKLVSRLEPPLGWNREELNLAAIVVRCSGGALAAGRRSPLSAFDRNRRQAVLYLAGILRLAAACDFDRTRRIQRLKIRKKNGHLELFAKGYTPGNRTAQEVAAARYWLEMVYRQPIMVRRGPAPHFRRRVIPRKARILYSQHT